MDTDMDTNIRMPADIRLYPP